MIKVKLIFWCGSWRYAYYAELSRKDFNELVAIQDNICDIDDPMLVEFNISDLYIDDVIEKVEFIDIINSNPTSFMSQTIFLIEKEEYWKDKINLMSEFGDTDGMYKLMVGFVEMEIGLLLGKLDKESLEITKSDGSKFNGVSNDKIKEVGLDFLEKYQDSFFIELMEKAKKEK